MLPFALSTHLHTHSNKDTHTQQCPGPLGVEGLSSPLSQASPNLRNGRFIRPNTRGNSNRESSTSPIPSSETPDAVRQEQGTCALLLSLLCSMRRTHTHSHMHAHTYIQMRTRSRAHTHTHIYTNILTCTHTHTHIQVRTRSRAHTHLQIYTHVHTDEQKGETLDVDGAAEAELIAQIEDMHGDLAAFKSQVYFTRVCVCACRACVCV
jgi:hypothetical protein